MVWVFGIGRFREKNNEHCEPKRMDNTCFHSRVICRCLIRLQRSRSKVVTWHQLQESIAYTNQVAGVMLPNPGRLPE